MKYHVHHQIELAEQNVFEITVEYMVGDMDEMQTCTYRTASEADFLEQWGAIEAFKKGDASKMEELDMHIPSSSTTGDYMDVDEVKAEFVAASVPLEVTELVENKCTQ